MEATIRHSDFGELSTATILSFSVRYQSLFLYVYTLLVLVAIDRVDTTCVVFR